ncbi:hypothetical protein [Stappia sp.]|uniref:hypothetical protein n=1 Tax=Stappia sp. TaxID=1870903 RepID=UPI0032D8F148
MTTAGNEGASDPNPVRGTHHGARFHGRTVIVDGGAFRDCSFESCRIVYCGGALPVLQGCRFADSRWTFSGEAANTLTMLTALHQGGFGGVVEPTLEAIRSGALAAGLPAATAAPEGDTARGGSPARARTIDLGFGVFPIPRIVRRPRSDRTPPAGPTGDT